MSEHNTYQQLKVTHLTCSRDEKVLFKPIQFTVTPGQALWIKGANGIGKTTLLRVLAGFLPKASGNLEWHGRPLKQVLGHYHQHVAYLGPQNGINTLFTPLENLRYQVMRHLTPGQIHTTLKTLQLDKLENKPSSNLSSGQKQRLALARIVLSGRKVWLLDEPTTSLDIQGEAIFNQLLQQHLKDDGMAVIVSHQDLTRTAMMKLIQLERNAC